ncbi:MAG: hypothetical protein HKO65_19700 [Gemmatimonadetes bacterium]|nr:hypothetical protein [Gemmatimonadota bacterium]NNM07328.1 hypothetical protein [Gemmatimonadota bacterium]
MKSRHLLALALSPGFLMAWGCTSRFVRLEGVYDLVAYQGKPIPFGGVRGGRIQLELDGSFILYTLRAVEIGQSPTVTDTTLGRFRLEKWDGDCTAIVLRAGDRSLEPELWADVCETELTIRDQGTVYKRTKGLAPVRGP